VAKNNLIELTFDNILPGANLGSRGSARWTYSRQATDLRAADVWVDEFVSQQRRSARRVWNNVVFVPNPPGEFHNLEGVPTLAHPAITTRNERKQSSMNTTTVYYLPGTTGWSTNFAGRFNMLWPPQVLTNDANFGVRTSEFGFTITWASSMTVIIEACTNLANPTWYPLATNTLSGGSAYFNDPSGSIIPIGSTASAGHEALGVLNRSCWQCPSRSVAGSQRREQEGRRL